MMKSSVRGKDTLEIEVTNISSHGIWLFVRDKELFMSYDDFPWFKNQTLQNILNVEEVYPYWLCFLVDFSMGDT